MNRSLPISFVLAALLAAPAATAFAQQGQQTEQLRREIVVTGVGERVMAPDMATLSLTVMRQAATAREALDETSKAMSAIVDEMKTSNIEPRDLQTGDLQINPIYVYPDDRNKLREPKLTGYQVSNTLSVRVRDLTKTGELLDKAVTLGVNQGGGITFTNADPSPALDEARKRAVADAMKKARILAEAAGVELGQVTNISDQVFAPQPIRMNANVVFRESAAQAPVPVEAGENAYRAQVIMTFELK